MSKYITKHYDSLGAALSVAEGEAGSAWGTAKRASRNEDSDFSGVGSIAEAVQLARHGWEQGRKSMVQSLESLAASPSLVRGPAYSLDVAGAYPVPALAASGDPLSMVCPAPMSERVRPIVRLAVSCAVSWRYEAKEIRAYGAGLLGIIDALESADFRCEITGGFYFRNGEEKALFTIKLKEAQDPLDLDRLAFCLCHAAFLRRIGFGIMESCLDGSRWAGGYGTPRVPDKTEMEDFIKLAGPQQFKQGGPELRNPLSAFKAMVPIISEQLADRFADFPPLQLVGA